MTAPPTLDLAILNQRLETQSTETILRWAWETFAPHIATSSSFQTQSVPLLHLISQNCPAIPIIFLDTGFHFPDTLAFRDELQKRYGLNIQVVYPVVDKSQLFQQHGQGLYRRDPDLCCYINKVEPMQRATADLHGLISGVRRDQTGHRANLAVLEPRSKGPLRIHPMLKWTKQDVWDYIDRHDLPPHPLFHQGYPSIGCAPCTRPVVAGENERAGRWSGRLKTECGLHLDGAGG